jgi:predicted amidohydrolase YtcJ
LPLGSAVLTARERIVAVGDLDDVRAQAAEDVELVDLQGATMTPGLVDTHPHMLHWSWTTAMQVPLWDCRDHADIVAAIRAEADRTPDGEVILCSPVGEPHFFHKRSYRDLEEAVLPDRHVLDQATSRHPVVHELMESGYRNQGANQRISRLEALAMFTSDAAKVLRWPEIGSIVPGNFADLTIVDRDPVECDIDTLHDTQVLQTIFNGEPVE